MQADRRLGVYAIVRGEPQIVIPKPMGNVVPFECIVKARVPHLVFALEDGVTNFQCLFSRYDENGLLLAAPHEESRSPYSETCDPATLPDLVKRLLDATPLAV
jgi:hypothetical protein